MPAPTVALPSRTSPVALPENHVDRAENGSRIGQHVALRHEIHRLEMAERRRANLAAIWLVAAVADQIDTELALRALRGDVDFTGRHVEAFGVELEVMDQ